MDTISSTSKHGVRAKIRYVDHVHGVETIILIRMNHIWLKRIRRESINSNRIKQVICQRKAESDKLYLIKISIIYTVTLREYKINNFNCTRLPHILIWRCCSMFDFFFYRKTSKNSRVLSNLSCSYNVYILNIVAISYIEKRLLITWFEICILWIWTVEISNNSLIKN